VSERAQTLAAQFERSSHAVIVFTERCSVNDWRIITEDERWPAGVVCRHIARGFEVHAELIRRAVTGQPLTGHTWETVHESNAQHAREWANCTKDETLALLRHDSNEAAAVVRQLSDAHFDRTMLFPLAGDEPISTEQIVEAMIDHPRIHLESLRATVGGQSAGRQEGTK